MSTDLLRRDASADALEVVDMSQDMSPDATPDLAPLPSNRWILDLPGDMGFARVQVGDDGAIYLIGVLRGSTTFGSITVTSKGKADVIAAKLSPKGVVQWATTIGGPEDDFSGDIALSSTGETLITAHVTGAAPLKVGAQSYTPKGGYDALLIRLDAQGKPSLLWSLGGPKLQAANGVGVAPNGAIVVGGVFEGSIKVGATVQASKGGRDGFLVRLNPQGQPTWLRTLGGALDETLNDLVVDDQGASYVVGACQTGAVFAGKALSPKGNGDGVVAKVDAAGALTWATTAGGTGRVTLAAVEHHPTHGVYVAGSFSETVSFGSRTLSGPPGGTFSGVFARLDNKGVYQWADGPGGSSLGYGASVDNKGNLYATGAFSSAVTFGGTVVFPKGARDLFAYKMSLGGATVWQVTAGHTATRASASGIAVDRSGYLSLIASHDGPLTLGTTNLSGSGGVVARFGPSGTLP